MGRPSGIPTFATDDDYSAGANAWSGQPNKVDPAGQRAEGLVPSTKLPADWANFLFNLSGAWIDYIKDIKVQNWQTFTITSGARISYVFYAEVYGRLYGIGGFDVDTALYTEGAAEVDSDWVNIGSGGGLTAGLQLKWGVANPAGIVLLGGDGVYRSTDGLNFTHPLLVFDNPKTCVWDPVNSLFIADGEDPGQIQTSPDGVTWTARTVSGAASAVNFTAFETDGLGHTIAIGPSADSAQTSNGTTWTTVAISGATSFTVIHYNAAQELWMIASGGGRVAVSSDRSTWTNRTPVLEFGFGALASDGAFWVAPLIYNADFPSGSHGIAYSTDDGVTWSKIAVKSTDANDVLESIHHFRNAFYVSGSNTSVDGGFLVRSMRMGPELVWPDSLG